MLAHPVVGKDLRQVAGAGVRQDHHHPQPGAHLGECARVLQRAGDGRTAAAAAEQTFLTHQPARCQEGVAVADLHDVIQHREIHRLGEKVFADAFDLVRVRLWHGAGLEVVIEDGPHGVDANHPQSRMTLLQKLSGRSVAHAIGVGHSGGALIMQWIASNRGFSLNGGFPIFDGGNLKNIFI